MATKKTSAEQAREQAEEAALGSMLDGAFGAMDGIEATPPSSGPTGPPGPSGPPSGPSGPPSGPPTGPPSGPPTGLPSGPPTGLPSGPPTGPPSGPPSVPPQDPPSDLPAAEEESVVVEEPVAEEAPATPTESVLEEPENAPEEPAAEEPTAAEETTEAVAEPVSEEETVPEEAASEEPKAPEQEVSEPVEPEPAQEESTPDEAPVEESPQDESPEEEAVVDVDREMEIARLTAEIERLRGSLVGAAEVIEELEETPMPPVVLDNIVIPPHIVADFARMGRQLSREALVKGTMGAISMLHPDEPGLMISTRHSTMLARLDERGIVGGRLGGNPPRGAIAEWKVHEVLLASVAMVTGGPAACIHMQGPYTTAASSEKDLILVQPIDVLGKEHIGKVVIVDPDDDAVEEYLRQVAEALQQGGMRCVVVRGHGAYAVGANLDQAMANAAMLEHSMQVLLLARQANLKL
ncbi:MAG: class II aldolase/adducin family protein [Candidatus Poseidoniaceae archaeon]